MMAAAASLYFLVRWFDNAQWADAALFVVFAALVWRVHLLDWPFYLTIAIYAAARLLTHDTVVRPLQLIAVAVATVAVLVPQAISAMRLARAAQTHVFVAPPTLHVFEHELHWNVSVICGAVAWLIAKLKRCQVSRGMTPTAWVLVLSWWLCQPVCLYLYSRLTGNSVYVGRYLSVMLPGAALTATAAVALWMPAKGWRIAAGVMALAALIAQGHWDGVTFRHDISDWRTAVEEVNRFAPDASTPVIAPSPFVEARPPAWSPDYPLPGFLYAHLDGYAIAGHPVLLPFDSPPDAPEGVQYAESLVSSGKLGASGKWAIYGPERHVRDWRKWFSQRPEFAAWKNTLQEFGDVYVAEFRRE
jgi:hypothetical protein